MTSLPPTLRKAAVLVSALDDRAAEALLAQMPAEMSAKVRSALVELDNITAQEQQQVLAEFLRQQGAPSLAAVEAGDEVTLELERPLDSVDTVAPPISAHKPQSEADEPPLAFLRHVEPTVLAGVLRGEHPQLTAVVVAHLPPEEAAGVLENLPTELATEALARLAWFDRLAPEVAADLARELRQKLAPHIPSSHFNAQSVSHMTAVLGALNHSRRQRLVAGLVAKDRRILARLGLPSAPQQAAYHADEVVSLRYRIESPGASGMAASRLAREEPPLVAFDDLAHLDDGALKAVFAYTDPQVVLLALTDADPSLTGRILRQLPGREAELLRRRLAHPGPVRLREIEEAQQELSETASRLAREGAIALPASARFAAAV